MLGLLWDLFIRTCATSLCVRLGITPPESEKKNCPRLPKSALRTCEVCGIPSTAARATFGIRQSQLLGGPRPHSEVNTVVLEMEWRQLNSRVTVPFRVNCVIYILMCLFTSSFPRHPMHSEASETCPACTSRFAGMNPLGWAMGCRTKNHRNGVEASRFSQCGVQADATGENLTREVYCNS